MINVLAKLLEFVVAPVIPLILLVVLFYASDLSQF